MDAAMPPILNARVGRRRALPAAPRSGPALTAGTAPDPGVEPRPAAAADSAAHRWRRLPATLGRGWRALHDHGRATAQALRRTPAAIGAAQLGLLLGALWPHLHWMARRFADGSDEPWGGLALATVLMLVARDARALVVPSPARLMTAAALALAATASLALLPPLAAAAMAMAALAVHVTGALPRRPALPLLALLLLSLPLIASLQFYLGYPLRAATAQAAAPLLAPFGIRAQAAGAALVFGDRTVLIDAPCAGIGMLWTGAWCAALLSYLGDAGAARSLVNGAAAAALVFAANVLRNVALFFPEAGLLPAPAWAHPAVGLLAFALALLPLIWFAQRRRPMAVPGRTDQECRRPPAAATARWPAAHVGACLAAALLPFAPAALLRDGDGGDAVASPRSAATAAIAWPTAFRGQPLTQLALTPLEARFARRFPGAIARFATGRELLVLRQVDQPTRQLHPAIDCFRAAGFAAGTPQAARDDEGRDWRCFVATRAGAGGQPPARLRVCERIAAIGDDARAFTDSSAWYWAALRAPATRWRATTVITPLAEDGDA